MRGQLRSHAATMCVLLALCVASASCGSEQGSTAGQQGRVTPGATPPQQIWNQLTKGERRRIAVVARKSATVESVLGSRKDGVTDLVPVTSANGNKLEGAVVTLSFKPAIVLDRRHLPAQIPPNQTAPQGTPPLSRVYRCSATGVTKLEVRVDLGSGRVVEIITAGPKVKITEMQLLGPSISQIYKPMSED